MKPELITKLQDAGYTGDFSLVGLIKACGYGFRSLTRHTEYNLKREQMGLPKEGRVWIAKAGKKSGGFLKNGHTPEEAVAKLWLELNNEKAPN